MTKVRLEVFGSRIRSSSNEVPKSVGPNSQRLDPAILPESPVGRVRTGGSPAEGDYK